MVNAQGICANIVDRIEDFEIYRKFYIRRGKLVGHLIFYHSLSPDFDGALINITSSQRDQKVDFCFYFKHGIIQSKLKKQANYCH